MVAAPLQCTSSPTMSVFSTSPASSTLPLTYKAACALTLTLAVNAPGPHLHQEMTAWMVASLLLIPSTISANTTTSAVLTR